MLVSNRRRCKSSAEETRMRRRMRMRETWHMTSPAPSFIKSKWRRDDAQALIKTPPIISVNWHSFLFWTGDGRFGGSTLLPDRIVRLIRPASIGSCISASAVLRMVCSPSDPLGFAANFVTSTPIRRLCPAASWPCSVGLAATLFNVKLKQQDPDF